MSLITSFFIIVFIILILFKTKHLIWSLLRSVKIFKFMTVPTSQLNNILSDQNLYSSSERDKIIRELDGELIASNSQILEIRLKKIRIVNISHKLGNQVPLLVFIHGFGGQVSQWEKQIRYFSQVSNILGLDLIGHGISEISNRIDDYTLDSIVSDVIDLIIKFESIHTGDIILVGHSFGTMVAVKVLNKISHLICGITLIAPVRSLSKGAGKKSWITYLPSTWLDVIRYFDRFYGTKSSSVARVLHDSASEQIRAKQLGWNSTSHSAVVQNMLISGAELEHSAFDVLSDKPLLLIGGAHDKISPLQLLYDLHGISIAKNPSYHTNGAGYTKNQSPSLIPDCGHNPMVEKPEKVNQLLLDFINTNCRLSFQPASSKFT